MVWPLRAIAHPTVNPVEIKEGEYTYNCSEQLWNGLSEKVRNLNILSDFKIDYCDLVHSN